MALDLMTAAGITAGLYVAAQLAPHLLSRMVADAPESDRDPEAFLRRVDAIKAAKPADLDAAERELDQAEPPTADEVMADYDFRSGERA